MLDNDEYDEWIDRWMMTIDGDDDDCYDDGDWDKEDGDKDDIWL